MSLEEGNLLYCSWSVLFKCINDSGSVFLKPLDHRIYKTKFLTLVSFIPPTPQLSFSLITLTFFDAQNLSLVTLAMLSLYQSPVNCRSSRVEGNFAHKVNYHYSCHFLAWNLFSHLKELDSFPSQGQGDVWILKIACFLENFIGTND